MLLTVRFPGAKIAPISSTCAQSHTRSLHTGANCLNTVIISLGIVIWLPLNTSRLLYPLLFFHLLDNVESVVFGDKAFISAEVAAELVLQCRIRLRTIPRANQKHQLPPPLCRLHNQVRQIIETVNGQLAEQFHLEINHAHTFEGLCTPLLTKLTAHTLSIYLNRLLGKTNFLQLKALAFPI